MTAEVMPAVPADAPALADIDAQVSVSPWSETQLATACAAHAGKRVLLARDGGQVVGFVVFSRVLDESSILNIAVHPGHQGKGLGRMLLDTALQASQSAGARRCLLEVRRSNTPARSLYAGCGFELDGVRKNYYPTPEGREDALLMSLLLQGSTHERA